MDKILEAIAQLLGWGNRQEVIDALHKNALPIAQHFINMGHGLERENSKEAIRLATEAKIKAENDLVTANATIENLKKDKPDIAAMQTQHQTAMDAQKKDFEKRLQRASEFTRTVLLDRDKAILKNHFVNDLHIEPAIADNFIESDRLLSRLDHDDKGNTTVFQAGTKTPMNFASGQQWFQVVGEEIKPMVPEKGFTTEVTEEGTGASGHKATGGGGGNKGSGKKTVFDTIRANALKDAETKRPNLQEERSKRFGKGSPART